MIQSLHDKVEVTVDAGVDGRDRISLQIGDSVEEYMLALTPSQARRLATELIAAVNRAEVKANLKQGANFWRQPQDPRSPLATAG